MVTYSPISSSLGIEVIPNIPAKGSIIWLHGLGADGHDFVSLVSQLPLTKYLPLRFIFPHAPLQPVTVNNGYVMRAWFDIYSMQIDQRIDEAGIANSVKLVEQLVKNEQKNGISTENIILGGFSQGAVVALRTGLSYPEKLAGVVALSGYLPNANQVLESRSQANYAIPIFIGHGTEDTIVPFALGQATTTALETQGVPVNWHHYAMSHSVCAQEISDIAGWIERTFQQ